MNKLFEYKGYAGSYGISAEDECLFGKIECINDLVTFEAETIPELRRAFEESVDDYLETCEEIGKSPDKPMSGSFNVRIGADLHKMAYLKSKELDISLNEMMKLAVTEYLKPQTAKQLHFHLTGERPSKELPFPAEVQSFVSSRLKTFQNTKLVH